MKNFYIHLFENYFFYKLYFNYSLEKKNKSFRKKYARNDKKNFNLKCNKFHTKDRMGVFQAAATSPSLAQLLSGPIKATTL